MVNSISGGQSSSRWFAKHTVTLLLIALYLASRLVIRHRMFLHWSDIRVYHAYAALMIHRKLPFREFVPEYPPLAMLFMALPALVNPSLRHYATLYRACCFVFDISIFIALLVINRKRPAQPLLYLACTTALGAVLFDRLDLVLGAMLLAGCWAIAGNRIRLAAITIGTAIAFKLIPIIWAPILLAWVWRQRGFAELCRCAVLLCVPAFLSFAVLFFCGAHHLTGLFTYHSARGIQLESTPATIEMLLMKAGTPGYVATEFGSSNLHTRFAHPLILASAVLSAGVVALATLWASLRRRSNSSLVSVLIAVLLATLCLSKVLSPQYFLIVIPLLAILPPMRSNLAAVVLWLVIFSIYVETGIIFPWKYWGLMNMRPRPEMLIGLRNLELAGLSIWMLVSSMRRAEEARLPD
jgi:hypothetical protein